MMRNIFKKLQVFKRNVKWYKNIWKHFLKNYNPFGDDSKLESNFDK